VGFLAKRRERHEQEAREKALSALSERRETIAGYLEVAHSFDGVADADGIVMKAGEKAFVTVEGAGLVEDRRGAAHWEGRSSGVSFPIGHIGRSPVRYRVGRSKGHLVQAPPVPTAIDSGQLSVTNRRIVFRGSKQTRECLFDKMLGYEFYNDGLTLSVSNRQKPTTVIYGADNAQEIKMRILLALAHYRQDVGGYTEQLQQQLNDVDTEIAGMSPALALPPPPPPPPPVTAGAT
jgi:hypothetical protein